MEHGVLQDLTWKELLMKIMIKEIFKDDYISREAGEKLRNFILENYGKKQKTILDFSNISIASTSFFDEGLAKLKLDGWETNTYLDFVEIKNLSPLDTELLNKVLKYRGIIK